MRKLADRAFPGREPTFGVSARLRHVDLVLQRRREVEGQEIQGAARKQEIGVLGVMRLGMVGDDRSDFCLVLCRCPSAVDCSSGGVKYDADRRGVHKIRSCLVLSAAARYVCPMPDADKLTPASPEDLAAAIAFALRYQGSKRVHNADERPCQRSLPSVLCGILSARALSS
jgi:hypothetical protein